MDPNYVNEKDLDALSFKELKEATGSYERTKIKQKEILQSQLNTFIDNGMSNSNILNIHQYNDPIGLVLSTFESKEIIYILSFCFGEYYIYLLHSETLEILEKIHFNSKLMRDTRRNMLVCILNDKITIISFNSFYQYNQQDQKWAYLDLFCSLNEKILLQNLIPLTYYQNSAYGIFLDQIVKIDNFRWSKQDFENVDKIDLNYELWLDIDVYPCRFPFCSQVVVKDS